MALLFLDRLPLWALLLFFAAILTLTLECGYRFGKWRHKRRPDEKEPPVGAMIASVLGLLAFMLGFTFSLASSRFDARREAVLEEANAVGTAYFRARLLPAPSDTKVIELLREYVDIRIHAAVSRDISAAIARSESIHEELWQEVETLNAKTAPHPLLRYSFKR